jgi:hypothetical protein
MSMVKNYQVQLEVVKIRKLMSVVEADTAKEAIEKAVEFTIKNYKKVE